MTEVALYEAKNRLSELIEKSHRNLLAKLD